MQGVTQGIGKIEKRMNEKVQGKKGRDRVRAIQREVEAEGKKRSEKSKGNRKRKKRERIRE